MLIRRSSRRNDMSKNAICPARTNRRRSRRMLSYERRQSKIPSQSSKPMAAAARDVPSENRSRDETDCWCMASLPRKRRLTSLPRLRGRLAIQSTSYRPATLPSNQKCAGVRGGSPTTRSVTASSSENEPKTHSPAPSPSFQRLACSFEVFASWISCTCSTAG